MNTDNKPKRTLKSKPKSPKKNFFWLIFGVFIFGGLVRLVIPAIRNGTDWSMKPISTHNELFADEQQKKLQHPMVFRSKIQGAQSNYNLPSGFHLTVYELYAKQDKPLGKLLRLNDKPPETSSGPVSKYADNDSFMEMTKTPYKIDSISTINLRYGGPVPGIKTLIQNDNLACYSLKFKQFSISYDDGLTNDIWANSADTDVATISLAFIKKKKTIYVVMLFRPDDKTHDFAPDMLLNMLKK